MSVGILVAYVFLLSCKIPLYEFTTIYVFVLPVLYLGWMDIWVIPGWGAPMNKYAMNYRA